MQISSHAKIRAKQRGIKLDHINLIWEFGTPSKRPGRALEIKLSEKDKYELIKYLKYIIQNLDKIARKAIIVNEDTDEILTAYNLR